MLKCTAPSCKVSSNRILAQTAYQSLNTMFDQRRWSVAISTKVLQKGHKKIPWSYMKKTMSITSRQDKSIRAHTQSTMKDMPNSTIHTPPSVIVSKVLGRRGREESQMVRQYWHMIWKNTWSRLRADVVEQAQIINHVQDSMEPDWPIHTGGKKEDLRKIWW